MADLALLEGTDPDREVDGVWVRYKADIEFRIARLNNPKHRDTLQRLLEMPENQARTRSRGRLAGEALREVTLRAAAEAILVGWRNLAVEGQELAWSPENAYRVLKFPDAADFILNYAQTLDPYLLAHDEVGEKNSAASSAGPGGLPPASTETRSNGSLG